MIVERGGKFYVQSEAGKNLGGPYDTREEAEKRLAQVEAFKKDAAPCSACKKACDSADGCSCSDCSCAGCEANDCAGAEGEMEHEDAKPKLQRVARIDRGELRPPKILPNGFLKVDARLTRTGVFEYRNSDGSIRRELRLPEEVFREDSLETFSMAPVTDDHPPVFLNPKNVADWQKGHMGESVRADGKFISGPMLITDAALIKKMQRKDAVEVSCGYTCDLEERGGVTADGERYDAIQRNIVGNHVAIVARGRAGSEARVRMDSGGDVLVSITPSAAAGSGTAPVPSKESTVEKKIKIDGVEYDAGSPQAAAAQQAYQAKLDAMRADAEKVAKEAAETKARLDKLQAETDAAKEKAAKLDAELKAAPARITAELKARMALESEAREVLGAKAKLDSLSDRDVKLAVLKELVPSLKLDGKSDAYVDGRYEAALESHREDAEEDEEIDGVHQARQVVTDTDDGDADPGDPSSEMTDEEANKQHSDSQTAYEAMCYRGRNAWRQPINGEAK